MDSLTYREAVLDDLPFLDALIEGDQIAAKRDIPSTDNNEQQREAMRAIAADPHHELWIVEHGGQPIASFHLSYLPGVSRRGAWRGQVESVRVTPEARGKGVGATMMRWAIARCEEKGCAVVQLTSDLTRKDAHRFYKRLGFKPSHTGFKLKLL